MKSTAGQYVPLLADVMRTVDPIPDKMTVNEVARIFQDSPGLLMLPICQEAALKGAISRRELFSLHLAKPYAVELYGKKPVSVLMNDCPLTMSPDDDVICALERLLEVDPGLEIDSFPVLRDACYAGVVHVAEMIMAISKAQAGLLDTLEMLNERIRSEVENARQIQQLLLPPPSFFHAGLNLSAGLINSTEISGDVYDYFVIDGHRVGVLVGDVSGHGVQSGMVSTAARAGLQLLLEMGVSAPGSLLAGMNTAVLATASSVLMMTAVIAVIDAQAGTLLLASAGHNYPYLFNAENGVCSMLDGVGGFPLGFDKGSEYVELEVSFGSGDRLLLYTDGIIEACNAADEEFGYERLEKLMSAAMAGDPETFRCSLVEEARRFSGSDRFEDDVTIVVVANETRLSEGCCQ